MCTSDTNIATKPTPQAAPAFVPPAPPPPPAPTAQGLTVGADRNNSSLQDYLKNTITARRGTDSLRTDLGGVASGGSGLNV